MNIFYLLVQVSWEYNYFDSKINNDRLIIWHFISLEKSDVDLVSKPLIIIDKIMTKLFIKDDFCLLEKC